MKIQKNVDRVKKIIRETGLSTDTFCFAPYINLDLDQSGEMYSCYRGKKSLGNWKQQDSTQEFNNDEYKNLRQQLYDDKKHENCKLCWIAEQHGSISPRFRFFDTLIGDKGPQYVKKLLTKIKQNPQLGELQDISRVEIRTSALCNLKCMHCGPGNSTQWIQMLSNNQTMYDEIRSFIADPLTNDNTAAKELPRVYKNSLSSDGPNSDKVKKALSHADIIQFSGGEPLLDPKHIGWLEYLQSSASKQSLDYNSNLNIEHIEQYFPLWKKFKSINLRVSIDSAPSTYEYFRRGGNFELVSKNIQLIKKYFDVKKLNLTGSITFNMFSALRWQEIFDWWVQNKLLLHTSLVINHPTSANNLPLELKDKCIATMQGTVDSVENVIDNDIFVYEWIKSTNDCLSYLKTEASGFALADSTITYLKSFDSHTNLKTKDYFPELENFL